MTSLDGMVAAMESAIIYIYQIGCPILMIIGTVSCIINLIVFTQKTLRKNPCSIYFVAYNLANFMYIYSSLLSLTLDVGYNIDPSAYNLVVCRLRLYIVSLFNCLSPFYLILASIDRIFITSPNALTRQRSTPRLAYICISFGTLFWALFHIHALIASNIMQLGPNYFLCYFRQGAHLTFVSYYSIIEEITVVSLMILFGLWSIKNIQRTSRVGAAHIPSASRTGVEGNLPSTSSKDRQLMFMLLMDTTVFGSCSIVFGIFLIYQQITQTYIKSAERIQIEVIVRNLCLFIAGIPFCSSCYTNLIASKTFRKEVKKILSWKRIFCIE